MFKSKQFLLFLVTGGTAALINFGSRFLFNLFFSYSISIVLAYLIGMITAYLLAKFFVFTKSKNSSQKEFFYFTVVNLLAVLQTWCISMGLTYWLFPKVGYNFYPESVAHAIGIAFPVFTSYIGHKKLSFKE